jgi:hypothetical protein
MGLFKDLKNMKDTAHAAPDMIRQAQELGAQAQALGATRLQVRSAHPGWSLRPSSSRSRASPSSDTPSWQQAYDGWNARPSKWFFKGVNELRKMGKEASNNFDAKATMADGMARMQAAQSMFAQQTVAAQLGANGEAATAQVLAARDTGTQINMQPVLEIDLLVTRSPPEQ